MHKPQKNYTQYVVYLCSRFQLKSKIYSAQRSLAGVLFPSSLHEYCLIIIRTAASGTTLKGHVAFRRASFVKISHFVEFKI